MKIKQIALLIITFLSCRFFYVKGQDVIIDMKLHGDQTTLKYSWDSHVENLAQNYEVSSLDVSLGISGRVYKWIYLRGAIGTSSIHNAYMDIAYNAPFINADDDIGYYKVYKIFDISQLDNPEHADPPNPVKKQVKNTMDLRITPDNPADTDPPGLKMG